MSKILYLSFIVLFLALSFLLGVPPIILAISSTIMISCLLSNGVILKKVSRYNLLALTIGGFGTMAFVLIALTILHLVNSTIGVSEAILKSPYTVYISIAIISAVSYWVFSRTFAFLPEISDLLSRGKEKSQYAKILDTSVIVDGRIADIAEKGFFDGYLIVPAFVLKEIQTISDSRDAQKRMRGRRALDIVNKMKSSKNIIVSITEMDFPKIKEVDLKLIELSKKMSAKVITNDFNLMKVAEIHGVEILNINDLANMLYVTVLPGDIFTVNLVREGKEKQALAYLEDGTMIVIDNAKHLIGKDVSIKIESILPKEAGRVIFASISNQSTKSNQTTKNYNSNNDNKPIKKKYNTTKLDKAEKVEKTGKLNKANKTNKIEKTDNVEKVEEIQ